MSAPQNKPVSNAALAGLFFFSGALALVYEALWQRRFSLIFGSSAPATAAVLAAYFAGLAFGAFVIGNRVNRFASPLKLYAVLELGIALGALFVELWLWLFSGVTTSSIFLKTILVFLALLVPTFCMGATLPALGAFIDRDQHHLGRTAGLLYAANTAGAALGVLAVPLLLLPMFGARNTLYLAATANLAIAAIAYHFGGVRCPQRAVSKPSANSIANHPHGDRLPIVFAFLSGAVAFIVQILWNRAFAQVHENSLYSFALIVATFIAALAVGAQITRLLLARKFKSDTLLLSAWLAAGLLLIFSPFAFVSLTNDLTYISSASASWWQSGGKLLELALLLIFPTAVLIGIALPAIFERAGAVSADAGKTLGHLLTANLAGSTTGALLAGFAFPRAFGLWGSMIFAGALLMYAVPLLLRLRLAFLLAVPFIFALFGIVMPKINLPLLHLASGRGETLIEISEGAHGIVAVTERGNSRRLKLNNSYVLGGTASTGDERMQSHIPLLLHPNPQRVAYLGLGTGISAGAATLHPIQQITLLELVPEVAEAARTHFAEANLRVLDQPNARLIVEDARNYLLHTEEKFDVIIGDLVVPWRGGEAALFTQESFLAGKNALKSGGIFCQWVPLFQLSEDEFRIVLNTFLSVFPEACLWRADFSPNETALALVGFTDGATVSAEVIRARLNEMARDAANPQLTDDYAVWMSFIGSITRGEVNPDYLINSENRPWVELRGSPGTNTFIGRRFQKWARELSAISLHRFQASEREAAAIHAGDLLFEFTLSLAEDNRQGAAAAQAGLRERIPEDIFKALFSR